MARALEIPAADRAGIAARFWPKVARGDAEACWPWTGGGQRYGAFWLFGTMDGAHRVAFALGGGVVKDGELVRHTCDNPPCCNPAHLLGGTYSQNGLDRTARGRGVGEDHHAAKLSVAKVRAIRASRARGVPLRVLARRFGVTKNAVWMAASGRTWKVA